MLQHLSFLYLSQGWHQKSNDGKLLRPLSCFLKSIYILRKIHALWPLDKGGATIAKFERLVFQASYFSEKKHVMLVFSLGRYALRLNANNLCQHLDL